MVAAEDELKKYFTAMTDACVTSSHSYIIVGCDLTSKQSICEKSSTLLT